MKTKKYSLTKTEIPKEGFFIKFISASFDDDNITEEDKELLKEIYPNFIEKFNKGYKAECIYLDNTFYLIIKDNKSIEKVPERNIANAIILLSKKINDLNIDTKELNLIGPAYSIKFDLIIKDIFFRSKINIDIVNIYQ